MVMVVVVVVVVVVVESQWLCTVIYNFKLMSYFSGADLPDAANVDDPVILDPTADVQFINTPLEEAFHTQNEVDRLKRTMLRQKLRWRREKRALQRELKAAQRRASILDRLIENGVLSKDQVRRAATGRRVCWSAKDVSRALGLRCISRKAYHYVSKVLKIPLPSLSTLSRRTRAFKIAPGVMDAAASVLESTAQGMSQLDRLCVISFDEMAVDSRYCYDAAEDQVLSASKLQVRKLL